MVLICSPRPEVISSVSNQLDGMKINWRLIDDYIFRLHADEILACYDLFDDDESKKIYATLTECRMKGIYPPKEIIDEGAQYFSMGMFHNNDAGETYIDCGAFVGDSVERYIWSKDGMFKKIIAFEPDKKNLTAFNYRKERLQKEWNIADDAIIVYPYGVSDESTVNYVDAYEANNGFGTKMTTVASDNTEECRVVAIDDFIKEPFGFLKADIESYEYKLLCGARKSIKEYSPNLAICIYHNAVDFFSVPLLMKEINPNYKFAIRHYTSVMSDSVVYAYTTLSE